MCAVKRVTGLTQNIDMFPTLLKYFNVDMEQMHYHIHGRDLLPLLLGTAETVRSGVLFGYFGKSVNFTDGRFVYMRAAKEEANRPLYIYTAIPTTLRQYYGVGCIAPEEYRKIGFGQLSWTNYPVYRIPADIVDFKNPSQEYPKRSEHNRASCLYDLKTDYAQEHPLSDPVLEESLAEKLRAAMKRHDSPEEQFIRLGL